MKDFTKATKASNIKRTWHLADLEGKILGRSATSIASLLMGKGKPYFVRTLDCGDYVVAINASKVKVSGKKEEKKEYYRYSGYPSGLKTEKLMDLRDRRPEEIIRHAVSGMLPQNRLKDRMLTRLHVFSGSEHSFKDKFSAKGQK